MGEGVDVGCGTNEGGALSGIYVQLRFKNLVGTGLSERPYTKNRDRETLTFPLT